MIKLSILIPVLLPRDSVSSVELVDSLTRQYIGSEVEIITDTDNGMKSIGYKRNALVQKANGEYLCFIDADDEVSRDYILKGLTAIELNPDCCSLTGVITWNGENEQTFEHSIKYKEWKTNLTAPIVYERYPNHLNIIRSSIAKQFRFLEINHGEDKDWSTQIHEAGVLKTEAEIPGITYHYKYKRK